MTRNFDAEFSITVEQLAEVKVVNSVIAVMAVTVPVPQPFQVTKEVDLKF